jgi:hypothetical protein
MILKVLKYVIHNEQTLIHFAQMDVIGFDVRS